MNYWCESCARKNLCYVVDNRPKCFVPITNTASGTPESYLAKSLRYSQDSHEIAKTENSSEKPNNCEHITEDGVTCAKYPACDDCLDNPLNKVKGSERLVKGSEQTEPTISKMEQVDKDINVRSKDEPQTDCKMPYEDCEDCETHLKAQYGDCNKCKWYGDKQVCGRCRSKNLYAPKTEPQTYVINPQEPTNDDKCFECDDFFTCDGQCDEVKDEPQTEDTEPISLYDSQRDYDYDLALDKMDCPSK